MSRESVVVGAGVPVCVSETGTRQALVGGVFLSATVAAGGAGTGTGTAVATGLGIGASLFSATGSGTGVATGSGVGTSTGGASYGSGNAVATGAGVGASLFSGVGSGRGVATGLAIGSGGASTAQTFSQEVAFRKYYMRKGKKLLLFDSVNEAEAYTQAETLAAEAVAKAQKTSRLARKRIRTRILASTLPVQTIDTDWLAEMMQRFAMAVDLPALLAQQDYNRVAEIYAQAMQALDEEDIELLLMFG